MTQVNERHRLSGFLPAMAVCLIGATAITGLRRRRLCASSGGGVVASTDVWGSVARAVAGRPCRRQVDPDRRRHRSALLPGQCLRRRRRSWTPPWWSTTAAVTTRGSTDGAGRPSGRQIGRRIFVLPVTQTTGSAQRARLLRPERRQAVAATIADRLAAIDPANAADYRANAAEFGRDADAIAASEHVLSPPRIPTPPSSRPNPSRSTC